MGDSSDDPEQARVHPTPPGVVRLQFHGPYATLLHYLKTTPLHTQPWYWAAALVGVPRPHLIVATTDPDATRAYMRPLVRVLQWDPLSAPLDGSQITS